MVEVDNFILTYLDQALAMGPKRIVSLQLDGETGEPVYARASFETSDGDTFWVTVQRTPSDV